MIKYNLFGKLSFEVESIRTTSQKKPQLRNFSSKTFTASPSKYNLLSLVLSTIKSICRR